VLLKKTNLNILIWKYINTKKVTDLNGTHLAFFGCPFFRIREPEKGEKEREKKGADLFSGSISPFLPYTNLLKSPPLHEQPHPYRHGKNRQQPQINPNKWF
jgi:hypothetical protein